MYKFRGNLAFCCCQLIQHHGGLLVRKRGVGFRSGPEFCKGLFQGLFVIVCSSHKIVHFTLRLEHGSSVRKNLFTQRFQNRRKLFLPLRAEVPDNPAYVGWKRSGLPDFLYRAHSDANAAQQEKIDAN